MIHTLENKLVGRLLAGAVGEPGHVIHGPESPAAAHHSIRPLPPHFLLHRPVPHTAPPSGETHRRTMHACQHLSTPFLTLAWMSLRFGQAAARNVPSDTVCTVDIPNNLADESSMVRNPLHPRPLVPPNDVFTCMSSEVPPAVVCSVEACSLRVLRS